jgi:hypothetical protein
VKRVEGRRYVIRFLDFTDETSGRVLDPLELFQKVLGASRKKTITVIQT